MYINPRLIDTWRIPSNNWSQLTIYQSLASINMEPSIKKQVGISVPIHSAFHYRLLTTAYQYILELLICNLFQSTPFQCQLLIVGYNLDSVK